METSNQIFSASRFGQFIKQHLCENRRKLLLYSSLVLGLMLLVAIAMALGVLDDARRIRESLPEAFDSLGRDTWRSISKTNVYSLYSYEIYHRILLSRLTIIPICMLSIAGSLAFARCAGKEGRLREFMCPASQLEKYLSSFCIYILGTWAIVIISWAVARYGVYLAMDAITPYGAFYKPWPLSGNDSYWDGEHNFYSIMVLFVIFLQSFFMLGSSVWPKNSFFKTFAVGFVLFVGGLFGVAYVMHLFQQILDLHYGDPAPWVISATLYITVAWIMTVVNYVVAYFRYREMDLTNRW